MIPDIGILVLAGRLAFDYVFVGKRTIRNAPDLNLDFVDIDGLDADAVCFKTRQDNAVASEPDIGGLVAKGDGDAFDPFERIAVLRRQTGAQRRGIILVEL